MLRHHLYLVRMAGTIAVKISQLPTDVSMGTGDYFCIVTNVGGTLVTSKVLYENTNYATQTSLNTVANQTNLALLTAQNSSITANAAAALATSGSNLAESAYNLAYAAFLLGEQGTLPDPIALEALSIAIAGTNGIASAISYAGQAYSIAVNGTNVANSAASLAGQAYNLGVIGTQAYGVAEFAQATANSAFLLGVIGTNAFSIASSASGTASEALSIAITGTNLANSLGTLVPLVNQALILGAAGTNLAQSAFSLAAIGTNLGTLAYNEAVAGSNLAWLAYNQAQSGTQFLMINGSNSMLGDLGVGQTLIKTNGSASFASGSFIIGANGGIIPASITTAGTTLTGYLEVTGNTKFDGPAAANGLLSVNGGYAPAMRVCSGPNTASNVAFFGDEYNQLSNLNMTGVGLFGLPMYWTLTGTDNLAIFGDTFNEVTFNNNPLNSIISNWRFLYYNVTFAVLPHFTLVTFNLFSDQGMTNLVGGNQNPLTSLPFTMQILPGPNSPGVTGYVTLLNQFNESGTLQIPPVVFNLYADPGTTTLLSTGTEYTYSYNGNLALSSVPIVFSGTQGSTPFSGTVTVNFVQNDTETGTNFDAFHQNVINGVQQITPTDYNVIYNGNTSIQFQLPSAAPTQQMVRISTLYTSIPTVDVKIAPNLAVGDSIYGVNGVWDYLNGTYANFSPFIGLQSDGVSTWYRVA